MSGVTVRGLYFVIAEISCRCVCLSVLIRGEYLSPESTDRGRDKNKSDHSG